jgi:hypothetical protein
MFAPCQLEERFGGEAPNLTDNFWPPRMPEGDCGADPSKIVA